MRRREECEWTEVFFLEITCIIRTTVDECAGLTIFIIGRKEEHGETSHPFLDVLATKLNVVPFPKYIDWE